MSSETLITIAGIILSLAFSYIPGVREWYEPLKNKYKQAIMGGLLIVVTGAIFGLSCGAVIDWVTCDKAGALGLFDLLIWALIANQSTYLITRKDHPKREC